DAATTWGVDSLPETPGRDGDAIVAALLAGELGGLVIGGVDPADTTDPAATTAAIAAASFVVALDLRASDVTRAADVVFPVAPVTDKAGSFVNWEGRVRSFDRVLSNPASLPDLRVLAGIAEELGHPLGFRTVEDVWSQMEDLGPWDGARATLTPVAPGAAVEGKGLVLSTWKQLLDNGTMLVGDKHLAATARPAVARVSQAVHDACGPTVTVTGDRGSVTVPSEVAPDLVDGVVWLPSSSTGRGLLSDLASPGTRVTVTGGNP
ncbi:molybdopterin-dependent oxidoreductase, partial [Nocardioides sp.]|uniref:molybdopterin-dependent oxidoreductase n=1 Tax=Nocardioides sp. TaxID=35761 RepID=UPI002715EBEC